MLYTGTEAAHVWRGRAPVSSALFEIRPSNLPIHAEPLFDSQLDAIIGYRTETGGVAYISDLDGTCISVTEKPLEAPLIDPIDAIFVVGAVWRSGARAMAKIGGYGTHAIIGRSALSGLRTRFAASSSRQLRFAAIPLAHMQEPWRFVPVHILRLAIRHGKRMPDPKGHRGIFQYTAPMTHRGVHYQLEVVVRESDYTVLHFVYKR
ncbi:hypothetical protein [Burkholderia lata]|uniref:Uncharacterized protein n=1 Tax=Burkholderia lata (strain ATCC 17760 / DSM 23089 / LMG 22485 / NCIMB 9086 / R18194 / 383) TaxID=482957 RepID=A0A6P2MRZ9_BURL3|nr:hypothetical protein [Burkholderia lata]VWB83764.1 hypothetical protein BLA15816_04017 [Burkholderia lata]VWC04343.1 hypothetical protein BLA15945_05069 [Burkholderia lata]